MGKNGILPRVGAAARWLCNSTAYQRGLPLYRRLSALSRRGCASTVADTLDKWVAEGNAVRKPVLLRCASELRRFNKHRHALELLEWLEAKGVGFSHRDQAVRLDLLGKTEGVSSAQSYFQTLEKNKYTYGALLSCYCQRGMLGEATSIFNQMKQEDVLPSNTLAYNNMISLYFKLGQFERVVEMFDEMKGEHGCPPDGCTYNLLMQSYAALKDIEKAERVMEEIREEARNGLLVSGRHYTTLASIHVAAGNYDKASLILKELEETTKHKDRDLFDHLITLYATMGNSSQVHRLWDSLRSKFPKITNRNYLVLLRSLAKLGDFEGLKKCYQEWKETSGCSSYDERAMLIPLNAYLERELIDEAELLYEEDNLRRNPTPCIKAIEMLIDFAVGKGMIGLATKYLNAATVLMKDKNLRLNSKRIQAFLKRFLPVKAMNSAEELLEELQKVRVDLDNEKTYRNRVGNGRV